MKFSVIMPSLLTDYPNSAKFKDQKIVRAIQSVLAQSFKDYELIVIADECELTVKIVTANFPGVRLLECKHKMYFDNLPRNTGIEAAKGEFITYLDIDDYIGPDHLKTIERNLSKYDWVWYNDFHWVNEWQERACSVTLKSNCGTSNITHRRGIKWDRSGYAHDYHFIKKLLINRNFRKIETPEYYVCHVPGKFDI